MENIFFWKSWNKTDRILYLSYLFIFLSSFVMLAYAYAYGRDEVMQWGYQQDSQPIKTIIAKTQHNLHDYTVEADQYIISEKYTTAPLHINPVYSYLYLGLIMIAMIMLLTVITYLNLWYYLASMTIFLLYLGYMQTELLNVFGLTNKQFLFALIIAYVIPSYMLRSYSHTGFLRRILIFTAITVVFLLCVYTGAQQVKQPLLFLPSLGIILPICITVVFLIVIGFDLIKAFLYMVSSGRAEQKKSSLPNFLIISGLYILSVLLTLLQKKTYIDWDMVYIHPLVFYTASAIYGIWAYKKRNVLFRDVLPFRPMGAFFYLGLAIVSTATMAFAYIMANDPLIEALEYAILYSQLCLSIIFVVYIIFNFYNFFATNLNIYDVVYKPNSMPFFMVRGIGIVGMIAMYAYFNQYPLRLAQAGYYNAAGDVYYLEQDTALAKQYYYKGYGYEGQNVRSSYALAMLYEQEGQILEPKLFYENALSKNKHVESFIGLSNIFYKNEQWFNSLFTLKDGLTFFPESAELYNNMGIVYEKLNIEDSALYCFERAYSLRKSNQTTPLTNLIFNRLKTKDAEAAKALLPAAEKFPENIPLQTNLAAVKSIVGEKVNTNLFLGYSKTGTITSEQFYLNNNYVLNHLGERDTSINNTLLRMQNDSTLSSIADNIRWLRALSLYYSGDKITAIELMMNLHLAGISPNYTNTIAAWMLNEQALHQSSYFYNSLMRYGNQTSAMNYSLSSALWNSPDKDYIILLDSLTKSQNTVIQKEAIDHYRALTETSYESVRTASEKVRYLFLHYHFSTLTETEILKIRSVFTQHDLIVLSSADLMHYYINHNRNEEARLIWESLKAYTNISPYAMGTAHLAYLDLMVALKDWGSLTTELTDIFLLPQDETLREYYLALALQNTNDKKGALAHYKTAVKLNPLNPRVCIAAADYFNKEGDPQDAYDLLQEAITYNTENGPLLVAYCKQAIQLNLSMYAEALLPSMTGIVPQTEINEIKQLIAKASTIE